MVSKSLQNFLNSTQRDELYTLIDQDGNKVHSIFTLKTLTTARKAINRLVLDPENKKYYLEAAGITSISVVNIKTGKTVFTREVK